MTTSGLRRAAAIVGALVATLLVSEVLGVLKIHKHHGAFPIPLSVVFLSVVYGCLTALMAVGLVLVYRANRVINFAQNGFAGVSAILFYELIHYKEWPYGVAVALALVAGVASGFLCELLFLRRFAKAPRLVATVVTLAVGQLLAAVAGFIPSWLGDRFPTAVLPKTPLGSKRWRWFPVVVTGNHILLLVVTVLILVGFAIFFRYSSAGIAIRGASENADRAELLGINTGTMSSVVWMLAAALAAVGAIMQTSIAGPAGSAAGLAAGGVGSTLLLRALAAAVIGGMEDLPVTVAAAIALSVFEQSIFFVYSQSSIVDGLVLVLIVAVLLLKRRRLARAQDSGSGAWAATEEIRPIPAELAGLPTVRSWTRRLAGAAAVVLLAYPWVMSPGQTNLGSLFCIYGIVVLSLVVLTGWGGQISLGQYGFVAVGAVIGGSLISRAHWPFVVALLLGSLGGAAIAVLIGLPALRIRGLFLAVTTLAFAVAVANVGLEPRYFGDILPTVVNRPKLLWLRMEDERVYFYFCLICLLLALVAVLGLRASRTGRVLIAMRDNERTAQSYGINVVRVRLATFAMSGFLAAFAGVLLAAHQHQITKDGFGPDLSVQIFAIAVIGGLGSPVGALSGAVYFGLLRLFVHSPFGQLLGTSAVLLALLMFFPGGLGAGAYRLRDAVLRRTAIRRRIFVPSLLGQFGFLGGQIQRVPLAPKAVVDATIPPIDYKLPSRIGAAGASQRTEHWSYG